MSNLLPQMLMRPEIFKSWLSSKLNSEPVGTTSIPTGCPLSTYIGEHGYQNSVSVRSITVWEPGREDDKVQYDCLPWMQWFVYLVDIAYLDDRGEHIRHHPVTASDARRVLGEALAASQKETAK